MVKRLVWLCMLLVQFGFLQAQEPSQRIKILYRLEFDAFSDSLSAPKEIWHQTLETAILNSENVTQVVRAAKEADLFAQAMSKKIPVFIHVRVSGGDKDSIQLTYMFRGIFSELYRFENSFEEFVPQEEDLISYFWLTLSSDLDAFIKIKLLVQIQGPAGTLVYGFSQKPLRIPESEYIFVAVPIPGTYQWQMKHKDYVTQRGIFMADSEHLVLTLPRKRLSFLTFLRSLDASLRITTLKPVITE